MKYGDALRERSVPQWAAYNLDYDELKNLIRVNTTTDREGQAITIPGQGDATLKTFERIFYTELSNQHERVDLFVKSKADELSRRLNDFAKKTAKLISQADFENGGMLSVRRREKFAKLESKLLRCGDDVRNLERFVSAQRTAFQKILKKYKKWTGSGDLSTRFTENILGNPKSFTRRDFDPLYSQYNRLLIMLREATPSHSESSSPQTQSRRDSDSRLGTPRVPAAIKFVQPPQGYWNEYDNGSEGDENEPYTIYIDPNARSTFPGAKTAVYVFDRLATRAKVPIEKVRSWLNPNASPSERRPLLADAPSGYFPRRGSSAVATDTENEDDESTNDLNDFPDGYAAHYATFPSISDQKLSVHREKLLVRATIGCFFSAFMLLLIASILVSTGRHRLRVEVDAGATAGVVASLLFATLGFTTTLYRWARVGWVERSFAVICFLSTCILSGSLLVLVVGNMEP